MKSKKINFDCPVVESLKLFIRIFKKETELTPNGYQQQLLFSK